jgi:hypothetical protein
LQKEVQQREGEKRLMQDELHALGRKFDEVQRKQKEMSAAASSTKGQIVTLVFIQDAHMMLQITGESQDLKDRLGQVRGDLDALRAERYCIIWY